MIKFKFEKVKVCMVVTNGSSEGMGENVVEYFVCLEGGICPLLARSAPNIKAKKKKKNSVDFNRFSFIINYILVIR